MALSVGDRLGPYEILASIGAGGMGEVYRAKDTRLKRDVAIKILPEAFARDPERMARFQREAEVLASLNHPNIAAIYGVEDRALIMELVEGASPKGPLAFEDGWHIASQIAAALEYAHERGVIHRDLKPANVKVTPEGVVKLLDFGLAKALAARPAANSGNGAQSAENSPTLTIGATEVGMILGTASYMSPEQAKGKSVDKRADIWAFGVVLYELLAGERPFKGEDVGEILASVIKDQPNLEKIPVPARPLIESCLEKDPKKRLRDIGDAARLIALSTSPLPELGASPASAKAISRFRVLSGLTTVFALAAIALGFVSFRHVTEEPRRAYKFFVQPPDKSTFQASSIPAISPDGRQLAFVTIADTKNQLWVRDLSSLTPRLLSGTEGAEYPFWSPDSRNLGFFADGKLKKIDIGGGPALTLCDAVTGRGGTWNQDDVILFAENGKGISRVSAAGGAPTVVTIPKKASGEGDHRFPWFLPDGRRFLYASTYSDVAKRAIWAAAIDSKDRKQIVPASSNAVYVEPGWLFYVQEATLFAQPFDARKILTTGPAVPIAEKVDGAPGRAFQNMFSVSSNGLLVYVSSGNSGAIQLTWFDRSGIATGVLGPAGTVNWGAISPDGRTVATDQREIARAGDIWLHDLTRGTASRFTFGPSVNEYPVWSPDGSRLAFYSDRESPAHDYQKAVNGTGSEEPLSPSVGEPLDNTRVDDWSRDGRYLILDGNTPKGNYDIWVMPRFGDRKPFPYVNSQFNEAWARLSPDGKWLAYTSNESKRNEIYVQSFPEHGAKFQISTDGGARSVWSKDGKELYFLSRDEKMMAVAVKTGAKFEAGVPKPLFDVRFPPGTGPWFDVSKDGRFLIPVIGTQQAAVAPMTVVVNWQSELKK